MKTQQINFRLSETARKNLALICETSGVNQTAAVEMALAALANGLTKKENTMSKFESRNNYFKPVTRCASGENAYDAAQEKFGKSAFVDTSRNASQFMPNPETVAELGEPIGEVVVRKNESFWVYAR